MVVDYLEQDQGTHYVEWPTVLSAVQRQKLLQDKIQRATKYRAALENCPVANLTRNANVRQSITGSVR